MNDDMLARRFYCSLGRLRMEIGEYPRTKRPKPDMVSFLLTERYSRRNYVKRDSSVTPN